MSKFKVGDLVVKKSGKAFSNGEKVVTVKETVGGIVYFSEAKTHIGQNALTHYGQTLAELCVKEGDVVEVLTCDFEDFVGTICDIDSNGRAVSKGGLILTAEYDDYNARTWRIISRATQQPNWLPCPADYKPQDNHEVTYHMGVPTHYYVTESVLVDVEQRIYFHGIWTLPICGNHGNATLRGQTQDGTPVGQWTIDMDAD